MEEPRALALIALGGAAGALVRYGIDVAAGSAGLAMPWATLAINLVGAFAIGLLLPGIAGHPRADVWHPALAIGVLGGFTTVSAFAGDTVLLLVDGSWLTALCYLAATLAGGLLAVAGGRMVGSALGGRR